jgi:hypothetical protein
MLLGIAFRTLTAHFLASSSAAGSKLERSKNLVQLLGGVAPQCCTFLRSPDSFMRNRKSILTRNALVSLLE